MYVSMDDMYTGDGSGVGAGFSAGNPPAAARVVTDVCGGVIFAVVAGTLRIFLRWFTSLRLSFEMMSAKIIDQ